MYDLRRNDTERPASSARRLRRVALEAVVRWNVPLRRTEHRLCQCDHGAREAVYAASAIMSSSVSFSTTAFIS